MKVFIDPGSGFCFGVERAIQTAEKQLDAGNVVYCLGEMVHNKVQMDKLKARGLKVIYHSDLPEMKGKTILLRAHGEPPETFQQARALGINVNDATCPIVTKLQQRINNNLGSGNGVTPQIVIFGKPAHAEVAGLNGNAGNAAIVVYNENDLIKIDFSKPVRLFSQTTMDAEAYQAIGELIRQSMKHIGNEDLVINKSVCKQVSGRASALRVFASQHDVIIFVGGSNSANGAYLFKICHTLNTKSYYISNTEDIDRKWFDGANTVGVTGATSTPGWLIKEVAEFING